VSTHLLFVFLATLLGLNRHGPQGLGSESLLQGSLKLGGEDGHAHHGESVSIVAVAAMMPDADLRRQYCN
jgi:hypothetical protein